MISVQAAETQVIIGNHKATSLEMLVIILIFVLELDPMPIKISMDQASQGIERVAISQVMEE